MADKNVFSRLKRLFSSDVIIRNIGGNQLKVLDVNSIQQSGQIETNSLIESNLLSTNEKLFLKLKLEGLTMEEITEDLGESAYKVRQSLRDKFGEFNDYNQNA